MNIIKKWIHNIFYKEDDTNYRETAYSSSALQREDNVHSIHIHTAVNGHVIEYFGAPINSIKSPMRHGDRQQTLWIVSEGESVIETMAKALVSAKLDK